MAPLLATLSERCVDALYLREDMAVVLARVLHQETLGGLFLVTEEGRLALDDTDGLS